MLKQWIYGVLLYILPLYSLDFTIGSYNVENLFDLQYDGTEYKEFIPYKEHWDKKAYNTKLKNIIKVIRDLDLDIIALQEIESNKAFNSLKQHLHNYKYGLFLKNRYSSVGVAVLSKYKILNSKKIITNKYNNYARYILRVTIDIDHIPLVVYINHWRSKRASESKRILCATALMNDISTLQTHNYIILGDLNSNYNEYITFKHDKILNDTYNITGINQILNTTIDGNFITKNNIFDFDDIVHYNLWLDVPQNDRFSSFFKNEKNTPDNIIIPSYMLSKNIIQYIDQSFTVFKPSYLIQKHIIKRWNFYKKSGYSDHLPIYASFRLNKHNKHKNYEKTKQIPTDSIKYLYTINRLNNPVKLYNIKVIYKWKNIAIITKNHDRSIVVFNTIKNLQLGNNYDITVNKIDNYFGIQEIASITNIIKKQGKFDPKQYYLDGRKIDIFNMKYQNSIIKNLRGTYRKNFLYFKHNKLYKIRLYFAKGVKKPKENSKIVIESGHLAIYKSQIQIKIYKRSDYK